MLLGMFGTTFSVAGAFYQIYAVREKKWTKENLSDGLVDSTIGIGILGLISLVIMATSATVLRGAELKSIVDVAGQLEPLIGPYAQWMFCLGLAAAALSSLLVNALIGGTVISDSLGKSARISDGPVKAFTVAGLAVGVLAAMAVYWLQMSSVSLIVTAQALTVIGVPLIAFAMLFLTLHLNQSPVKKYAIGIATCVQLISLLLSCRLAILLLL